MTSAAELLTPTEAADFLRCKPDTLAVWRSHGRGPEYLTIGKMVRYRRSALEAWAYGSEVDRSELEKRAACHNAKRGRTKRLKGRRGAELRERRLKAEPFCRDCARLGFKVPAEEVDHIVPLAFGGSDDDSNVRTLCGPCHLRRTQGHVAASRSLRDAG